jgi:hypothetical protein
MGCDIHFFVEKYNSETGRWEAVSGPNPTIEEYRHQARWLRTRGEEVNIKRAEDLEKQADRIESGDALREITSRWEFDWNAPKVYEGWLYSGRNYALFTVLANVRSRHGYEVISTPRGLPDDVSDEVNQYLDEDGDLHSRSYLTLNELLEYDWLRPGYEEAGLTAFYEDSIVKLMELSSKTNGNDVRIVFGFDN